YQDRRAGPRPLRRVQRRRGVSHVDQPLHLPGAERERRSRVIRDSRADHAAAQRRVLPARRLRLRRAILEAAGLDRAGGPEEAEPWSRKSTSSPRWATRPIRKTMLGGAATTI